MGFHPTEWAAHQLRQGYNKFGNSARNWAAHPKGIRNSPTQMGV